MNAERLLALSTNLIGEYNSRSVINLLNKVVSHLQSVASSPQDSNQQQNLQTARERLREALRQVDTDQLPPTSRKLIVDLGLSYFFGEVLSSTLDAIFDRNQITPAVALTEITSIRDQLQNAMGQLQAIKTAFTHFNIEEEGLEFGQAELAILIPRIAVENELHSFGEELKRLDRIIKTFFEYATGSVDQVKISQISSSDLSIFLQITPDVAAYIAVAIERIVALYKNVLEIRLQHARLKELKLPTESLKGIEEHANQVIENGIRAHVDNLFQKDPPKVDAARQQELRTAIEKAMIEIAYRIDSGYSIDVRAGKPLEQESGEEDEETRRNRALAEEINRAAANIKFVRAKGDPILLPKETRPSDSEGKTNK